MSVARGQTVVFAIGNENADGSPANALSISAVLYRNGAATVETVTPANLATGIYSITFTVPNGFANGDILQVRVVADGIGRFVWGDSIDVTVNSVSTIAANTYAVVQLTDSDVAAIDTKLGTPAGASLAADIAAVKSDTGTLISRVTTTVTTLWANLAAMITGSGANAKYTATALENAPSGGGSGGSGDAEQVTLLEVQETVDSIAVALAGTAPVESTGTTVFEHLEQIQDSVDTYISSVTAAVSGTQDTIVGFPASLTIGDSYTEDGGNAIHVFIRDENDDPITTVGSKTFTDSDFAPELIITHSGNTGRVRATVTYVDPGAAESYLRVELPSSETRRASPGSATMQCVLKWDGVQKTLATQAVSWVARL